MYTDYYQLTGKPFQLNPDERFFYNSKGHNRAMAYLRYGLEQRQGFIVITGGIGTGKSLLVKNLFAELDSDKVAAAHLVTTQVHAEDLIRLVSGSFGLPYEGSSKAMLLQNLEAFFRDMHEKGKRVLIVIDEAQNLPPQSIEELRMLSNFEVDGTPLVQSFLLGQVELRRVLQGAHMEQFRQRIIAGYHLRPLDAEETRKYIEHRLEKVGWNHHPDFSDGVFTEIFRYTRGIPRRINTVCDRLMVFGFLEELDRIDDADACTVIEDMQEEMGVNEQDIGDGLGVSAAVPSDGDASLMDRISLLESEISMLKLAVMKDRQLLRKAVMMQLEDDVDVE